MVYQIIGLSVIIAIFSGFWGVKNGYSFWRQFVTGFIASSGIIALIYKLVKDYL
jgi:hypothetical protein